MPPDQRIDGVRVQSQMVHAHRGRQIHRAQLLPHCGQLAAANRMSVDAKAAVLRCERTHSPRQGAFDSATDGRCQLVRRMHRIDKQRLTPGGEPFEETHGIPNHTLCRLPIDGHEAAEAWLGCGRCKAAVTE